MSLGDVTVLERAAALTARRGEGPACPHCRGRVDVLDFAAEPPIDEVHAASADQRAGKLVATGATGFLPNGIIKKAVKADRLDGVDSISFARLPLFATVTGTGAIVVDRGAGANHPGTDVYRVFFTDPVHRCGHVATATDGAHVVRTLAGKRVGTDTNVVEARLYTLTGAATDGGFTLAMVC